MSSTGNIQEYRIEMTADKGWLLWVDNQHSHGPFRQPMIANTQFRVQIMWNPPCSTACPMASVERTAKDRDELIYVVQCGHQNIIHHVTVIEPEKPKSSESKILTSV